MNGDDSLEDFELTAPETGSLCRVGPCIHSTSPRFMSLWRDQMRRESEPASRYLIMRAD